jgi:hypothetical protein
MLAKRGGYATQQAYRATGRVGPRHPAHRATMISALRRERGDHHQHVEARDREVRELSPKRRRKVLPIG